MKVLDSFGIYFIFMMIIQGVIVGFYDSTKFKKLNLERDFKIARFIGIGAIVVSLILFSIKSILT
ncbi:CLC_0170 family protein [Clostridium grantii]|uniref:Uncharacterized protein n=1 Tax=Clostridium grantii DSM 8605 TaxID=1121316 RepID=A0A1M5TKT5_9CLOT|nr:CLC_0170 family protein [Clostridium grantii]SHH51387.1 hypothetical protein SAMN02745207_01361 [Clostridium grantii DSM 8605]